MSVELTMLHHDPWGLLGERISQRVRGQRRVTEADGNGLTRILVRHEELDEQSGCSSATGRPGLPCSLA